jgi:Ca2+-binding RTX toxin-like protein
MTATDAKTSVIETQPVTPANPPPSGGTSPPAGTNPPAPVTTPTPTNNNFLVQDETNGHVYQSAGTPYSGPVAGLTSEFIIATSDNINITAQTPNVFISTDGGSGEDAIAVNGVNGNNVLNGSTGSSFLYGGTGNDTFFVDDRNPPAGASIWSTVVGFHSGDAATIWGVTPNDFTLSWVNGQGATGYAGLTLHATEAGKPTASLTLAGFTTADLTSGRLAIGYGTTAATGGVPGSTYMYVHAS